MQSLSLSGTLLLLAVLVGGCIGSPPAQSPYEPMRMPLDTTLSCDSLVKTLALSRTAATLVRESLQRHAGAVVRWPVEQMPLSVWIQPPSPLRRTVNQRSLQSADWMWAINSALDHWSVGVPGVAFETTRDSAAADIRFNWVLSLSARSDVGPGEPVGRSAVFRDRSTGAITSARVLLVEIDRDGRRQSIEDVHIVAGHEIGHVLGLGHQEGALSAMARSVRVDGTTLADRSAARAWYSLPLGSACRPEELP